MQVKKKLKPKWLTNKIYPVSVLTFNIGFKGGGGLESVFHPCPPSPKSPLLGKGRKGEEGDCRGCATVNLGPEV